MIRILLSSLAIGLTIAFPSLAADPTSSAAGAFLERNAQGRYDLAGQRQSLDSVLRALADLEDFELVAAGLPPTRIERDYRDVTAEQLIDRLTGSLIVATEYVPGRQSPRRLKKVVIYANLGADERKAATPSRQAGRTADEATRGGAALTGERETGVAGQGMANLAQQDTTESALLLAEALESPDAAIRRKAILALAKMRNEQALLLLGQVLFSSQNADERHLAAEQLQRHSDPGARALLAAATDDSDSRIQALAAAAAANQP